MPAKSHLTKSNYADYVAKADALQELASYRVDELIDHLNVNLNRNNKMYIGCCPVHGGDRRDALRLYHDGHTIRGNWVCYTRHCETHFRKSLLGFVRGVLSHQRYGWSGPSDRQVAFNETVDFISSFLGVKLNDVEVNPEEVEKRRFAARMRAMLKTPQAVTSIALPREKVRQHLIIPADYYVRRGYSSSVLESYDVGLYRHAGRELSDRVVVPVYDDEGKMVVGFTGRSIFQQCETCKFYHGPDRDCPKNYADQVGAVKWRNHPKDFNVHSFLYNYWAAKAAIKGNGVIVLAEGPGEVWRLEEAGVKNACALFGCHLTDEQQVILERSGAMTVVLLLNNDEAGREGRDDIKRRLSRSYRVVCPELQTNDLGELPVEKVISDIVPVLTSIKGY
jgi:5S rRNA maturation endonuclease (ribonuclease M5)